MYAGNLGTVCRLVHLQCPTWVSLLFDLVLCSSSSSSTRAPHLDPAAPRRRTVPPGSRPLDSLHRCLQDKIERRTAPNGEVPSAPSSCPVSRNLLLQETCYSTIERECLALVWAVQKSHIYLYVKHFIIESDDHLLQYLYSTTHVNNRALRLNLRMQAYSSQTLTLNRGVGLGNRRTNKMTFSQRACEVPLFAPPSTVVD